MSGNLNVHLYAQDGHNKFTYHTSSVAAAHGQFYYWKNIHPNLVGYIVRPKRLPPFQLSYKKGMTLSQYTERRVAAGDWAA